LIEYIFEYFKNSETDSLDAAADEFKDDDIEIEDLQLARIKFMSEMAN
jgi:ATP-dependent DNA helicase RecQ